MIGRKIRAAWSRVEGTVVAWEPLSAAMTDVKVQRADGSMIWVGSSDCKPIDNGGPLPTRENARETATAEALTNIKVILGDHVHGLWKNWEGCNFGKVFVGNALIDAAKKHGATDEQIAEILRG